MKINVRQTMYIMNTVSSKCHRKLKGPAVTGFGTFMQINTKQPTLSTFIVGCEGAMLAGLNAANAAWSISRLVLASTQRRPTRKKRVISCMGLIN